MKRLQGEDRRPAGQPIEWGGGALAHSAADRHRARCQRARERAAYIERETDHVAKLRPLRVLSSERDAAPRCCTSATRSSPEEWPLVRLHGSGHESRAPYDTVLLMRVIVISAFWLLAGCASTADVGVGHRVEIPKDS